jgi:hypothetical protein
VVIFGLEYKRKDGSMPYDKSILHGPDPIPEASSREILPFVPGSIDRSILERPGGVNLGPAFESPAAWRKVWPDLVLA